MAKLKLDDDQQVDLEYLKANAEKVIFQQIEKDGNTDKDGWWLVAETNIDCLEADEIVAVYELVGFRRVNVSRSLKDAE